MRAVKFIMISILLAGCTTVQRGPALTLAENGHAVASQGQATVVDFAASVDGAVELQLIDGVVTGQQAMSIDDPLNVGLLQSGRNLSDLVRLRGRALGALAGAYDALADEANDDAPAAMGAAVAKLTDSATAFATAAGIGAPAIALASGVINSLAKEAAASAQQRRLILASRQIAAATSLIADAIDKEAALYAKVAASLGKDRQNFVATLMAKGVADPSPTVRDFVRRQGLEPLPVPPTLAVPMAQSLLRIRDWRAERAAADLYAAQVRALRALAAEHAEFEAKRPLRSAQIKLALAELAGWAEIYAEARAPAKEAKP